MMSRHHHHRHHNPHHQQRHLYEASLYGSLNHGDHRCLNMSGLADAGAATGFESTVAGPVDAVAIAVAGRRGSCSNGGARRNGRSCQGCFCHGCAGVVRGNVVVEANNNINNDGMNVSNYNARNYSSNNRGNINALAASSSTAALQAAAPSQMTTLIQLVIAFLVAGFGNVGAGLILDYVKEWPVFMHLNELFVLVPSLLGLKGNLELTMASRLSTQANLGHMDNIEELHSMAKGNLALVQCQATVVSFVVAVFASFVRSLSAVRGDESGVGGYFDDKLGSNDLGATTNVIMKQMLDGQYQQIHQQQLRNGSVYLSNGSAVVVGASNNIIHTNRIVPMLVDSSIGSDDLAFGPSATFVDDGLNGFDWNNSLVLCASSLLTANIACFVLGSMMILVIVGSHRVNIDPDNIASPVAASLGDMTTAGLLAIVAHSIYSYSESQRMPYLALVITLVFLGMLPVWWDIARKNPYTADVVTKGWTPIVLAVFISSSGGMILEYGKSRFNRLPVFQPVVNGVGGNLVAVQASRLATSLHKIGKPGDLPANFKLFSSPLKVFFDRSSPSTDGHQTSQHSSTVRLLLFISIPAHLLYFYVIRAIEHDSQSGPVTMLFLSLYMLFAVLQVAILLYLAQNLVSLLWRCRIDPDNYSTPLLTATGDLLGCAFLLVVFVIAYQCDDPYATTIV